MPDGRYEAVGFRAVENRYELSLTAQVFDPVILIVK